MTEYAAVKEVRDWAATQVAALRRVLAKRKAKEMTEYEALVLIQTERQRQINVEGWSPQHDDEHDDGEMARAAAIYYLNAKGECTVGADGIPLGWPWDAQWWKPKDPLRDLVRAGALFTAEKERLFRMPGSGSLKRNRARRMDAKIRTVIDALIKLPHISQELTRKES